MPSLCRLEHNINSSRISWRAALAVISHSIHFRGIIVNSALLTTESSKLETWVIVVIVASIVTLLLVMIIIILAVSTCIIVFLQGDIKKALSIFVSCE